MQLPGHTGADICIAFSPNGKFAATHGGLGDHSFHMWDITSCEIPLAIAIRRIKCWSVCRPICCRGHIHKAS